MPQLYYYQDQLYYQQYQHKQQQFLKKSCTLQQFILGVYQRRNYNWEIFLVLLNANTTNEYNFVQNTFADCCSSVFFIVNKRHLWRSGSHRKYFASQSLSGALISYSYLKELFSMAAETQMDIWCLCPFLTLLCIYIIIFIYLLYIPLDGKVPLRDACE